MGRGRGDLEFNVPEKENKKLSLPSQSRVITIVSCIFGIFATPGPHISPDNGSLATLCVLSGRG